MFIQYLDISAERDDFSHDIRVKKLTSFMFRVCHVFLSVYNWPDAYL